MRRKQSRKTTKTDKLSVENFHKGLLWNSKCYLLDCPPWLITTVVLNNLMIWWNIISWKFLSWVTWLIAFKDFWWTPMHARIAFNGTVVSKFWFLVEYVVLKRCRTSKQKIPHVRVPWILLQSCTWKLFVDSHIVSYQRFNV